MFKTSKRIELWLNQGASWSASGELGKGFIGFSASRSGSGVFFVVQTYNPNPGSQIPT